MNIKNHGTPHQPTRRDFLKQAMTGLAGLALSPMQLPTSFTLLKTSPVILNKGRVLKESVMLFTAPKFSARPVGRVRMNTVVELLEDVQGEPDPFDDSDWYRISSSLYLHASGIQLVENLINPVQLQVLRYGQLAKVTVPFARACKAPFERMKESIIFFYGSNHWVTGVVQGEEGKYYYKIEEDRWQENYFVLAECLHLFSADELKPISGDVSAEAKRLEVDLKGQQVIAYENGKAVFHSKISSGYRDSSKDYSTPPGEYRITLKRPSRHMTHSDPLSDADSELYGVPWMCNFTDTGIAFHGTYWHNEFTHPRSHGCINLPIEAARWIYLWCDPPVPAGERKFITREGTSVFVR